MRVCFLCGKPGTDYETSVLLNDGCVNVGHLTVQVHMKCLLKKGGTFWIISETPQLTSRLLENAVSWPPDLAREAFLKDLELFRAEFPELARELDRLRTLAKRVTAKAPGYAFLEGRFIWLGVPRPVDMLCALRLWKQWVLEEHPELLTVQSTLFELPNRSKNVGAP